MATLFLQRQEHHAILRAGEVAVGSPGLRRKPLCMNLFGNQVGMRKPRTAKMAWHYLITELVSRLR